MKTRIKQKFCIDVKVRLLDGFYPTSWEESTETLYMSCDILLTFAFPIMESKERSSVALTWLFTYLEKIFLQNSIKCLCCFGLIKWEPQISPSRIVELLSLLLIPIWTNVCAQQRASVICLTHRMVLFCEIGFVLWSLYINFYIYNFSLLILAFLKFIQLVYHDSCMFHFHFDSVLNSSLLIKFERRFSSLFNDAMANGECLSAVKWKCFVLCYMSENRSVPLR